MRSASNPATFVELVPVDHRVRAVERRSVRWHALPPVIGVAVVSALLVVKP